MLLGHTLLGKGDELADRRSLEKRMVNIPACWTVPTLMPKLVCNLLCIFVILCKVVLQ